MLIALATRHGRLVHRPIAPLPRNCPWFDLRAAVHLTLALAADPARPPGRAQCRGSGREWVKLLCGCTPPALETVDGPLQRSLFDTPVLAEIDHPDYPGERLIACRNLLLAIERARKRDALLAATEAALAPIAAPVAGGRLTDADRIGIRLGKAIDKFQRAKHFASTTGGTICPKRSSRKKINKSRQ
jgi:hypothetical protein